MIASTFFSTHKRYVRTGLRAGLTSVLALTAALAATSASATGVMFTGAGNNNVAIAVLGDHYYTANNASGWVTSIPTSPDLMFATSTIPAGIFPNSMVVANNVNKVFVASNGQTVNPDVVTAIDGATHLGTQITVGRGGRAIAYNPNRSRVYVANFSDGTVSVIDATTNTVLSTVTVGIQPIAIAVDTNFNKVYVANMGSPFVSMIDGGNDLATTSTQIQTGVLGNDAIAVDSDGNYNRIYVVNEAATGASTVSAINGNSPATAPLKITVGASNNTSFRNAIAVDPVNHKVFVSNNTSNTVSVFPGLLSSVIAVPAGNVTTVKTGITPGAMAVSPASSASRKVVVTNRGSSFITVIDGTTNNSGTDQDFPTVSPGAMSAAFDPVPAADGHYTIYTGDSYAASIFNINSIATATANPNPPPPVPAPKPPRRHD